MVEGGTELSEGQKQRLSIARALISSPKILLLDEVTANLDNVAEGLIVKTLSQVKQSATTVVIAHRLSTILEADLIVVLEKNGEINNYGTHQQLLKESMTYRNLYDELIQVQNGIA